MPKRKYYSPIFIVVSKDVSEENSINDINTLKNCGLAQEIEYIHNLVEKINLPSFH